MKQFLDSGELLADMPALIFALAQWPTCRADAIYVSPGQFIRNSGRDMAREEVQRHSVIRQRDLFGA